MIAALSETIWQLFHLLTLFAVIIAPLPALLHVLANAQRRSAMPTSAASTMLAGLVLWTAMESLLVAILGWTSHLRLGELLFLEGALLVGGLWLQWRDRRRTRGWLWRDVGLGLARLAERPAVERWLLSIASGIGLLAAAQDIVMATDDWDSLSYQLPRVAEWYQRGTFLMSLPEWAGCPRPDACVDLYPYAWHTLFYLAFVPVDHDQFILLPNLVAWLVLGLSIYGLARLSGGQTTASLFAATLVLLMRVTVRHLHTAHVDLAFAGFFLASVCFSIRAWEQRQGFWALLAVTSASMMLGTKGSGVGYLILVVSLVGGMFVWDRVRHAGPLSLMRTVREHPLTAMVAGASIGLLGSSWYVRNALETGNPLGFVRISILGRVLWDGALSQDFINKTNLLNNFHPGDRQHWVILARGLRQFVGLSGLALVALAVPVPWALLRQKRCRPALFMLIGLCLGSFYLYIAGPWSAKHAYTPEISEWVGRQTRYAFPFLGLLAAIAGATLRARPHGLAAWGMGLVVTVAAADALGHVGPLFDAYPRRSVILLAATVGFLFLISTLPLRSVVARAGRYLRARSGRCQRWLLGLGVGIGLVALLLVSRLTLAALGLRHAFQDSDYGGITHFVNERLPPGLSIGYWGTSKSYLLYGRDLRRPIRYLPLDGYRTFEEMLAYIQGQGIDLLAIGPSTEASKVESWLMTHEETFRRVQGKDVTHHVVIYRVTPAHR